MIHFLGMTMMEVVILALVQGLTEFLPVSSSGHLVLTRELLRIGDANGTAFDAFLHLGTLLAVLWYYRQTWQELLRVLWRLELGKRSTKEGEEGRQLIILLAVATVPAAVVGWGLQEWAEGFRSAKMVGLGFLFTAGLLMVSEYRTRREQRRNDDTEELPSLRQAIGVGLAQVLALLPSVSRSGTTIATGQLLGLSRQAAVRFSFLLSAPIIAGAGLSMVGSVVGNGYAWQQLVIAFLVSFGSGLLAIAGLTRLVERSSLVPFVIYLLIIGVVVLLTSF